MRTIPLGGKKAAGRVALVDDEDYELVLGYGWYVKDTPGYTPYAMAYVPGSGVALQAKIRMHSLITGWPYVDHRNGNGLDNQRSNLRPATHAQNMANARPRRGGSSQYKGVSLYRKRGVWAAFIQVDRRRYWLGYFSDEIEAARAYDAAAREAFGEYAYLNFG